jgi:FkbM family methyltransferase
VFHRVKYVFRNYIRSLGYNISRLHPDTTLDVFLRMLTRDFRINCVLDVGAGGGEFGQMLRTAGYDGWIVSFEPTLAPFQVLAQRCARDRRWIARREALGDEHGWRHINVAGGDGGSLSFHEPSAFGSSLEVMREALDPGHTRQELVKITTLGRVFDKCVACVEPPRVFLKTDTQGHELEVMRGGRCSPTDSCDSVRSVVSTCV